MSEDKPVVDTAEGLRSEVIEKFGLDEETQDELIEKLVEDKIEDQKKLSKTIEQKAKYRELGVKKGILDPVTFEPIEAKADATQEKKPEDNKSEKEKLQTNGLTKEDVENEIFLSQNRDNPKAQEHLDILRTLVKVKGISFLDAQNDPFYKHLLEQEEEEAKKEKAQLGASTANQNLEKPSKPLTREEHMKKAMEWKG